MFCALTYLFGHSIYFARLRHVNPQCKHKYAFLQMKEAPNQKVQEKKPLVKSKNTKKYMCLERIWRKECFRACRHQPLDCALCIPCAHCAACIPCARYFYAYTLCNTVHTLCKIFLCINPVQPTHSCNQTEEEIS